jgi:cellulose synthase/poly-beta-1,6-N-acetylglucosamine synthase-like glycosyltransferase/phosphoglycerol transferase MdoB-like AlkP superfamily enzyme
MLEFAEWIFPFFLWTFLAYSVLVALIYVWIGFYSFGAVMAYNKKNTFTDYSLVLSNPNAPTFSLIAPAYNEGVTIVENVRSLLSLYYHKLEIIIVNDGSKDDSIEKLILAYDLEKISFFIQGNIETKPIRGIYKSKNPAFKKLIVVDKENGGKADALNVGVNISTGDKIVCIDVDCILEQDAIAKLAKPFLEQTDKKVIACGGVIRLANNCTIENGKVTQVNLPKTWLGRAQALEYIRAFVLGRMAWSRASGLILISGAFGAFDRKIVIECGGYDIKTVGEDMELVVRMRRFMEEQKRPYAVINIPDSLCWTEAPESKAILKKQRNRWMRGTMETLWKHRKLMFNPKYGKLGMISLPYWFFFEFLSPLIEFSGYFILLAYLILGIINLPLFLTITAMVITGCMLFSIYAILVDLVSCRVYTKRKDFIDLIRTALVEPLYFHTMVTKATVSGFFDYFKKGHTWGEMTRQGFQQNAEGMSFKQKLPLYFKESTLFWAKTSLVFLSVFILCTIVESQWYIYKLPELAQISILFPLLVNNLFFVSLFILGIGLIYSVVQLFWPKMSNQLLMFVYTLSLLMHFIFFIYFAESRNILGADLFYYSKDELIHILKTSGLLSIQNVIALAVLIVLLYLPIYFSVKIKFRSKRFSLIFITGTIVLAGILSFVKTKIDLKPSNEFISNAIQSKWSYFFRDSEEEFVESTLDYLSFMQNDDDSANTEFPFLKQENTPDVLGAYFNTSPKAPNLVFIIVEGLGHAYSSDDGYVGNFTPYINELSKQSLYWPNCISSSGRTFGVLPSLTGSLPFGKNGILEEEKIPENFNLFNVLKKNGFETGFYYGGDASFDGMKKLLDYSHVDRIVDESKFDEKKYKKLPKGQSESWGYDDQSVFSKMLNTQKENAQPYFNVALTLSTHSPFLINDQSYYEKKYDEVIKSGSLSESQTKWALQSKAQLSTVLNLDDAVKNFIESYRKRTDFSNTIFVITGDHSMPEISMMSKIDRYHVPLIIYSPMLKESKEFRKLVSHFDVAPSFLAYYHNNYGLSTPRSVAWVGGALNTNSPKSIQAYPMMKSKDKLNDFVFDNYHLADGELWEMDKKLLEDRSDNQLGLSNAKRHFDLFQKHNAIFSKTKKLMPDSIVVNFMKKK